MSAELFFALRLVPNRPVNTGPWHTQTKETRHARTVAKQLRKRVRRSVRRQRGGFR